MLALVALAVLTPRIAHADYAGVDAYEEFGKHVREAEEVTPLKSNVFGDQVSLYSGSAEFNAVDVAIPGNNALPVEVGRRLQIVDHRMDPGSSIAGFGDWDIDVPYIDGTFTQQDGWTLYPSGATNRCSDNVDWPYTYISPAYGSPGYGNIGDGNRMHLPGGGDEELLANNQAKSPAYPSRATYPWVSKSGYKLSCLASAQNGLAGESFVALSPSGITTTFNWAVTRQAPLYVYQYSTKLKPVGVPRIHVYLLATRVQDRFGNWVAYSYGGVAGDQLTSITSSDGRSITLNWVGSTITSITSARGTWSYGYAVDAKGVTHLSTVTRPDGSKWSYTINSGSLLTTKNDWPSDPDWANPNYRCQQDPGANTGSFVYTVGAPSGASATYDFRYDRHQRTYIPKGCPGDLNYYTHYPSVYDFFDNYTLISKTISGPGLATQTWSYSYAEPTGTYFLATAYWDPNTQPYILQGPCPTCALSKVVTVTGPSSVTKYTFGVQYAVNEGQLLDTEIDDPVSGAALKTITNVYVSDTNAPNEPFANIAGYTLLPNSKHPMDNRQRPTVSTQIVQDGATFSSTVNSFDAFARTLSETASSSLGYSKTTVTTYFDHIYLWVLGQIANRTVNGIPTEQSDFYGNALPGHHWVFGKLQSYSEWNTDGTLAAVLDGNNHTTTLGNWYRGIPRNVHYADNTGQSATVNAAGWITAVVDENGYATGYGYDTMGRLASIAYPTSDDVAWNTTTRVFAQINGAEYGIPAGHWRQMVQTGNGMAYTFYDALWRPLITETFDAANVGGTISQSVKRYDAGGRAIFVSVPINNLSNYATVNTGIHTSYDALDRAIETDQDSELGTLKTLTAYQSGFKTQVTDPRGFATTTSYLAYDTPSTAWPVSIVSPENETTTINRDVFGKPTLLIRRGPYGGGSVFMQRLYVYDGYQQLCKRVDPESGATVMAYDYAGNLQWSAAGLYLPGPTTCDTSTAYASGRRVDRTYDPRNHLLSLTFPDHQGDQTWSYWPDGQPKQVSTYTPNGNHTFINAYTYDKRRLLTGESVGQAGWYTDAIGYAYDANGHLSTEHRPSTLNYAYAPNALGQATQIATPGLGTYVSGVSYYPDGKVARYTLGNGIVHTLSENVRDLPARITDAGAQGQPSSLDLAYSYDADGNPIAITDYSRVGYTRTMGYDGLDRLFDTYGSPFPGNHHYVYAYDPLDNIRSLNRGNVQTTTYGYDATNRLTQLVDSVAGNTSLSYDVQGNLATRNGVQYQFDYGNRLREVPGQEGEYGYDAYGRRIVQLASDGGILNQYSRDGKLMYSAAGRTGLVRDYLYLAGTLVASHNWVGGVDQGIYYQHTDAQGTLIAQSNASGAIIQSSQYDPYGQLLNRPVQDGPGYASQITDERTHLSYAQQRYYDPSVGRFLSMDPIDANTVSGSNFNRYVYVGNNPISFTDPLGLAPPAFPQGFVNAAAGFGDALSFGLTALGRSALGIDNVNACSDSYSAGQTAAIIAGLIDGEGEANVVFQTGHYADRLAAVGLDAADAEAAVAGEVNATLSTASEGTAVGPFSGRVTVGSTQVEYRAFPLSNGNVNVGTIFPVGH